MGGAFTLHNNPGASETVEGRENAAEGGSRPSVADCGRRKETGFSLLFSGFSPLLFPAFVLPFLSLHTHFSVSFRLLILSLPPWSLSATSRLGTISVCLPLPYLCLPDSELLLPPPLLLSHSFSLPPFFLSLPQFQPCLYSDFSFPCNCPSSRCFFVFFFDVRMPVLEGLWGPDFRMRDASLGVGVEVGVCPDEAPRSPVWGPLRMPPVTCGGRLSLALELPALIRQLRAAWRARRGSPLRPERSQASTWVEAEKEEVEEVKHDIEDRNAHLEADGRLNTDHAGVLLVERRGSYPLIDLRILKTSAQQGEVESGTRRKVKRLLSFQRYCHASRLLRGLVPHTPGPLHLLDDDYLGQAVHMLSKVGTWNFDIFLFDRLTNGNSLVTLMCHLFNVYGLIHHFQLDMVKLHRFLGMVQEDYHSQNPYHNAVHAADVTQAMYCYLKEPKLAEQLSPLDVFLGLMAAAAHDVDHPGVNQPFLIKTRHHLASLYQNTSVLESHHWRSTVGMLRESGLLSHLPADMSQDMERQLGSLILATDISRQNEFLLTFREHLDNQDLDLQLASHRHFILQIALKCADVCNPCRVWELSRQWSERVCEEFYRQGDLERKFDLEISPLCNQQADSVPAVQIGFISYIVQPLFEEWHRFTEPSFLSQTMMGHLHKNQARWSHLRCTHTPSDTQTHPHTEEPEPERGRGEGEDIP